MLFISSCGLRKTRMSYFYFLWALLQVWGKAFQGVYDYDFFEPNIELDS